PDAAPAAHRPGVGRVDPSDNPRPPLRRQVEEALLRATRTRLDHRTGRLRRLGECPLPRRRGLRLPTTTRNHRPNQLHQGDHSGGDTTTGAARVDQGGEPHAGLVLRSHQGRTAMQNAATSGYQRGTRTRTTTRKPAWIDPLLTFMVRRGSTVRVRQRAGTSSPQRVQKVICCPSRHLEMPFCKVYKRMMGFEPTTFCMANASDVRT